jgi:tetratricopeptide (TPR) repeat protein
MKGICTDITSIYETLKQAAHQCDQNSISISFVKSTDGVAKTNLDELDQSFMYTQILKEILLTIDFQQTHIDEFLTYCREQFVGNITRLRDVDKLEKEYHHHQPIWWYTSDCFLYSMLNQALRTMEVDLIIRIGFFMRALHRHVDQLHSEQYRGQNHSESFTVFRGQGLSQADFDQLMKTSGGLISFNCFLSTSLDELVSTAFAESNQYDPNLIGILFKITVNPSISSTPFSYVTDGSYYTSEEEILFSMHSVFRIGQVKQIDGNNRLYQVELTLTSDSDPQLHALTERIREETYPGEEGWYRLGQVLIKLGEFNKAQQVYDVLLSQTSNAFGNPGIYFQLGWIKSNQGEYEKAIAYYENLLEINERTLSLNHSQLASSYNNIGLAYNKMGKYSKALSFHEKALEIRQQILPPIHPNLATSYNNIGKVHDNMGQYSKALSCFEKALTIWQEIHPSNHPDLAISHGNIGAEYVNIGKYSEALSHFQRTHEIRKRVLPSNHPDLAASYNNIGMVYGNLGEYSKAVSYFEEALEIVQKTVSPNHPDLATFYNNIGGMYDKIGEYWKALFYFQIAYVIRRKILSPNHPYLAASYNNIGFVYYKMGKYSKALSYYEKALKIFLKTLSPNHPNLAICYNNIGGLYQRIGNCPKALSCYERALEIGKQSLPENHPTLQMIRGNINGARM